MCEESGEKVEVLETPFCRPHFISSYFYSLDCFEQRQQTDTYSYLLTHHFTASFFLPFTTILFSLTDFPFLLYLIEFCH